MGAGNRKTDCCKFHIDYVDREIIAEIAERLKRPKYVEAKEMPPGSLGGRIVEALSYGYPSQMPYIGYTGAYLPTWEMPMDNPNIWMGWNLFKKLATSSAIVIRGRLNQFSSRMSLASTRLGGGAA